MEQVDTWKRYLEDGDYQHGGPYLYDIKGALICSKKFDFCMNYLDPSMIDDNPVSISSSGKIKTHRKRNLVFNDLATFCRNEGDFIHTYIHTIFFSNSLLIPHNQIRK